MATSLHLQECLSREIRYTLLQPILCHGLIFHIYQTAEWTGGQVGHHDQNQNALRGGSQSRDQPQAYDGQQNYQQVGLFQCLAKFDIFICCPAGVSAAAAAAAAAAGGTAAQSAAEFCIWRRLSAEPGECRSAAAEL